MIVRSFFDRQGRHESNVQPLVLETSALPVELRPYGYVVIIAERDGFVKAIGVLYLA